MKKKFLQKIGILALTAVLVLSNGMGISASASGLAESGKAPGEEGMSADGAEGMPITEDRAEGM